MSVTSPYHIRIAPTAHRQIKTLSTKYQKQLLALIDALAINPRLPGAHKIEGMIGLYRFAESEHSLRLIYKIEDQEILLLLVK